MYFWATPYIWCLYNLLELCHQCKVGNSIFLASGSQVGTWPFHVHPWRLHRLHPWWWDREFWENNVWTWKVNVEIMLKTCRTLSIIFFYDIGLLWGNRFGHIWMYFVRYNGLFGTGRFCEGSALWWNYLQPWKIYLRVSQLQPFGSPCCWKMALEVLGSSEHGPISAPRWWNFLGVIVGEWSIVWGKLNAVWVPLSSCFSDIYAMAHIVVHRSTKIPSVYSMWCPSSFHSRFFMNNYLCFRRG